MLNQNLVILLNIQFRIFVPGEKPLIFRKRIGSVEHGTSNDSLKLIISGGVSCPKISFSELSTLALAL